MKVLVVCGGEWLYSDVCKAIQATGWADRITHIISGGTKLFAHSELWAQSNGRIIEKYTPRTSKRAGQEIGWVAACKKRNYDMVRCANSVLFLYSPNSPNYHHTLDALTETVTYLDKDGEIPQIFVYPHDTNFANKRLAA